MSFFTPNIAVSNPIPQEVRIYYSKDFAILNIIFLLILMGMGISFLTTESYFLGIITCLSTLSFIIVKMRRLFNSRPQVILNRFGIETASTPFFKWSEITEERVSGKYTGRGPRPHLEYKYPGGKEQVKVEPLNIRPQDLDVLLKYYRKPWVFRGE